MNSRTLPSFWRWYHDLQDDVRRVTRKAYRLWRDHPFHPSLAFKCIDKEERIWSVSISLSHRALGVMDGDTVTGPGERFRDRLADAAGRPSYQNLAISHMLTLTSCSPGRWGPGPAGLDNDPHDADPPGGRPAVRFASRGA